MLATKNFAALSILEVAELAQKALKLRIETIDPESSEEASLEAEGMAVDAEMDAAAGFRFLIAIGVLPEMPEQLEHYTASDILALLNDKLKEMFGAE